MISNNPLKMAFLVSVGAHSLLLSPILATFNHPLKIDNTKIEVTYIKTKEDELIKRRPLPVDAKSVSLKKEDPVLNKKPPSKKEILKKEDQKKDIKKDVKIQKEIGEVAKIREKVIDLNTVSFRKGNSDSLNYLRAVRNRIDSYVHGHYDASLGEDEIILHFVLNSDGSVRSAYIKEGVGLGNKALENLCLDSIYHSSPFKPFPKGLDLPHAAFNISVSFRRR